MYSIEFSKKAQKFFNKLSDRDAKIISMKIDSLKENPFRYLKRLEGHKLWRLRVMKYRVIVDVVVSGNRIVVLRIGYRKNVY
ncbi:MAG: type II toxin-antitoxin system RelE/ParE family toxin [archaeon]